MTQTTTNEMPNAKQRHWMYGLNVALLVIIGAVTIGFALYTTANYNRRLDWTSGGIYSLSDSTKKLIQQIDQKGQKYELVTLFTGRSASGSDQASYESARRVQDLLDEYGRRSKDITVENLSDVPLDELMQKIRDRYTGELKPYEAAVGDFDKVAKDMDTFAKGEAANLSALAQQPGVNATTAQAANQFYGIMGTLLPDQMQSGQKAVQRITDSTVPDYTRAVAAIKAAFNDQVDVVGLLAAVQDPAKVKDSGLEKYFADATPRYAAVQKEVKDYLARLDKLTPLKVSDITSSVANNSIVVLGPKTAQVINEYDIIKQSQSDQPTPGLDSSSFVGEQAVSSALLAMVNPDKQKVVFVTATPTQITSSGQASSWSGVAERLKELNFDVMEWSPPGPQTSPDQPPPSPTPPASGKGVVWIVFPPDAPTPQQMMSGMPPADPKPIIAALKEHLATGGRAMLLASSGGGLMGGGDTYAYDEIAKTFGIVVQPKYTVVRHYELQDGEITYPRIVVTHYADHEITRPLQSLQSIFMGVPSGGPMGGMIGGPTIVGIDSTMPAGVEAAVLVNTPNDADHWGETAYARDAKFDKGVDYAPPCPLAAAGVKDKGDKDKEERLVVLGSTLVGADSATMDVLPPSIEGNHIVQHLANPGNLELIANSTLWLAGYENMIAVSSKSSAAQRIQNISPGALIAIRTLVFVLIPFGALALGGVVWLFRRR